MLELSWGGIRNDKAGDGKDDKEGGKGDREIDQEFFETPPGIIAAEIAAKSPGKSRSAVLEEDRNDQQYGDDYFSDVYDFEHFFLDFLKNWRHSKLISA